MAGYVIKLQHTIIALMTESNSPVSLVLPSLPAIYSTSEDTRKGVVSALAQQYQRMVQARPLGSSYLSRMLSGPWKTIASSSTPLFRICTELDLNYLLKFREQRWVCSCGFAADCWGHDAGWCGLLWVSPKGEDSNLKVAIEHQDLCQYHFVPNDPNPRRRFGHLLYCSICYNTSLAEGDVPRYTREQIRDHFEAEHSLSDLRSKNLVYYALGGESQN
jgi:hypothetical protein